MRVDAQGYVKEFYDGTTDYNSATLVVVTAGVTVTGTDFTLEVGGSISGTVYQSDGVTPIVNADVFAGRDGGGGGGGTQTKNDGTYNIAGLAAGNYRVKVDTQGYVKEFYDGTTDYNSATLVVVTAGVTATGTDFTLEVGGSISGTVYQADGVTPIVNADVRAERDGSGGGRGAKSSGDGTYVITGLSSGSYRVIGDMGGYVEELYDNTMDFNLATLVVVTTGVTSTGTDFTLELGGIISGMVTEADGHHTHRRCCGGRKAGRRRAYLGRGGGRGRFLHLRQSSAGPVYRVVGK